MGLIVEAGDISLINMGNLLWYFYPLPCT